ncbi:hypothetical protein [Filimonas effusa]|uniref:Uncharacterized protein n=1 Tax=Filimonas effusa TaxID=2508721 RepID=A0A4Q1D6D7_9BACT|nr:hypothetical protein [Filimonas effusa]RXK83443.1 hypothetical protein ESB13_15215 [Filimonas effusa]
MKRLAYQSGGNPPYQKQQSRKAVDDLPYVSTHSHIRVRKYWRYIFLGVVLLAKVFLILSIYYYVEYRHSQKQQQQILAPAAAASNKLFR